MVAWWEAMNLIEQIFAVVGIASTVLLVIQVVLLVIGMGGSGDAAGGADAPDAGDIPDAPEMPDAGDVPDAGDIPDVGDVPDAGAAQGGMEFELDMDTGDISVQMDGHAGDWYGDTPTGDFTAEGSVPDTSAGGLHLFTLQGIIAFFAVFGWSGLVMLKAGIVPAASIALAVVFGFVAMVLIAWAFKAMLRLQQDGSLDIRNALGKSGTVYLTVPQKRTNQGKVSIVIQERLLEMDAVTDEDAPIKTGMEVTVVGISNKSVLIVRSK